MTSGDCVLIVWRCVLSDHRSSGGDAAEGEGAGRGPEETGSDPTAAEQVPAVGAAGRQPGAVKLLTLSGWGSGRSSSSRILSPQPPEPPHTPTFPPPSTSCHSSVRLIHTKSVCGSIDSGEDDKVALQPRRYFGVNLKKTVLLCVKDKRTIKQTAGITQH